MDKKRKMELDDFFTKESTKIMKDIAKLLNDGIENLSKIFPSNDINVLMNYEVAYTTTILSGVLMSVLKTYIDMAQTDKDKVIIYNKVAMIFLQVFKEVSPVKDEIANDIVH